VTVAEAVRAAARRLAEAGVPQPQLDAELLLRDLLSWNRARVLSHGSDRLEEGPARDYARLIAERSRRRPLQHLTGRQAFWRHEFVVTPDVLIPRPETELLVEAALEVLQNERTPVVVDVGTGSGNIAVSLACALPRARLHATDVSPAALAVAETNARRLGCRERVRFYRGDLLEPCMQLSGTVDLIASNPPYVRREDAPLLAPEVRDHEPEIALFGLGDVLSLYARLARQASALLRSDGWLLVEIGAGMADRVGAALAAHGLRVIETRADLQGIPRAVLSRPNDQRPDAT
jgi:release factor glutamine methyltransferase